MLCDRARGAGKPNTGTVEQLWIATAQAMPSPSGGPGTGGRSCNFKSGRRQNEATAFTLQGWKRGRKGGRSNVEGVEQEKKRQWLVNARVKSR